MITDKDVRFLLSVMLCMDPAERISAAELLTLDAFTPYFEAPDKQDLVEDGEHVISQSDFSWHIVSHLSLTICCPGTP